MVEIDTATMSSKGQIVIPASMRKDIKEGEEQDESTKVYEPIEYMEMIRKAGFKQIIAYRKKLVIMSQQALIAISMYPRFADGGFENYEPNEEVTMPDPEMQSELLVRSVHERNLSGLSRIWRDYLMRKPLSNELPTAA